MINPDIQVGEDSTVEEEVVEAKGSTGLLV